MTKVDVQKLLGIIRKSPTGMTATSIANEAGFSKASSIRDSLDELVDSGSIEIDKSGRYEMYKAKSSSVKKVDKPNEKVTIIDGDKVSEKLPEASSNDLHGYHVESVKVKDKVMKKITTPDGKKIRMENDEKLLVINNDPKYVVKTAEDIITCIRKYAMDSGLTVFSVDDIKQNRKISNDKDVSVKDDHIMFLSIKKHNKAA